MFLNWYVPLPLRPLTPQFIYEILSKYPHVDTYTNPSLNPRPGAPSVYPLRSGDVWA